MPKVDTDTLFAQIFEPCCDLCKEQLHSQNIRYRRWCTVINQWRTICIMCYRPKYHLEQPPLAHRDSMADGTPIIDAGN